ncbi:MAG: hypothetical protein ACXQT1_01410 [Methermicoccaceae archaeon]
MGDVEPVEEAEGEVEESIETPWMRDISLLFEEHPDVKEEVIKTIHIFGKKGEDILKLGQKRYYVNMIVLIALVAIVAILAYFGRISDQTLSGFIGIGVGYGLAWKR